MFGRGNRSLARDTEPRDPSAYGVSKLGGELALQSHGDAVSLRFSSIYGPGMTAPNFLTRAAEQGYPCQPEWVIPQDRFQKIDAWLAKNEGMKPEELLRSRPAEFASEELLLVIKCRAGTTARE